MGDLSFSSVMAAAFGVALWAFGIGVGVHSACHAYHVTPDVEHFRQFAQGPRNNYEGKVSYLFFPEFIVFLVGVVTFSLRSRWLDAIEWKRTYLLSPFSNRAILMGVGSLLFLLVTAMQSDSAIAAAKRIQWHGDSQPTGVIAAICSPFH